MTTSTDAARQALAAIAEEAKTLPARRREVVREAKEAGLSPVEMAFTLDVTVATIYNWLKPESPGDQ